MSADHQRKSAANPGLVNRTLASCTVTVCTAVVCLSYVLVPGAAESQIHNRASIPPTFSSSSPSMPARPVLPKAPKQVDLPPPPAMRYVPGLEEPLVATGPVSAQENKDLDAALAAFHDAPAKAGPQGDFADYGKPLLAFIAQHPGSNWNAALNLDIGLGYYDSGYYSRSMVYLDRSWKLGRNAQSVPAKRMTDRAVAELADMHARLGHTKELEALFADIGNRPMTGMSVRLMEGAHNGLGTFKGNSGIAYLCGPAALRNVMIVLKANQKQIKVARDARSGHHGFSLEQLSQLADKAQFAHTLIHREIGQPIPVPSIINWGVHHYAAIIGMRDGKYVMQDPTFVNGAGIVTASAIDAEGSGYFLVPSSVISANPKANWRTVKVHSQEAKDVYGMGVVYNGLPGGCTGCDASGSPQGGDQPDGSDDGCSSGCGDGQSDGSDGDNSPTPSGMTIAKARISAVSLSLADTPVGYKAQKGKSVKVTVHYNSQDGDQPANHMFSNVSPLWTFTWQSYIIDDPNNPGSNVKRIISGGGGYDYDVVQSQQGILPYNSTTGAFLPETYDNSQLVRSPASGTAATYTRYLPDGGSQVYGLSNGAGSRPRLLFLTSVVDPQGNATTLNYDHFFRITSVVDAMGRSTSFTYGLTGYPYLITKITDPFGRAAQLNYDTSQRLSSITDAVGITSSFGYLNAVHEPNFVTTLTTPYGASQFSDTPNPNDTNLNNELDRSLAMTDPLGHVELYYLFLNNYITGTPDHDGPGPEGESPSGDDLQIDNDYMFLRNVYYWDRHVAAGGNVTTDSSGNPIAENWTLPSLPTGTNLPTIYHWFHQCCQANYLSNELESMKKPLEEFSTWYNIPNMGSGYISGSYFKHTYVARLMDDGSSQLFEKTFNVPSGLNTIPPPGVAYGNLLSKTDPLKRSTTYAYASNNIDLQTVQQETSSGTYTTIATYGNYNSQHEPQTYTGADGQNWHYTYNSAGQLTTVTDPNSNVTTYNYDSIGRLSTIVNANHVTVLTLTYDSADRVLTRTDSEGYTLTYNYDNLNRVTTITYPDTTTDLYDYTFQSGPLMGTQSLDLRKHTDRLGRITTYTYDANRKLISVTEPVTSSTTRTTSYDYYENGTLKDIIDADGNDTHWEIDLESRPVSKTYGYGTPKAQTETYAYEVSNPRLHSITDALGQVKTFTYALDNRITNITYTSTVNPTPNVTLTWDPYFPRLATMVDGLGTTTYGYTPIGTNGALKLASLDGPFTNDTIGLTYDALGRLSGRTIPGGNETFGYDVLSRLNAHGTPLGSFTYGYLGQTDQTTSRSVTNGSTTVSTGWGYDTNTNDRRLIAINNSGVTRSYTLGYGSGPVNVYDIMSVTDTAAPGHPWATQSRGYGYDQIDRLLTATATTPGNDTYGYDKLDNATTVTTPSGTVNPTYNVLNQISTWGSNSYSYDANGNLLSGDGTHSYKWDAENRLIEIDYVGSISKSKFSYDGVGHRLVDVENTGTTGTTRYLWCGSRICQSRSSTDTVLKRYLSEGEYTVSSGQQLIYMPDQLGSVRDVLNASTGALTQSYDFTPYGSVARSTGTTATGYQYARLFAHPQSGLSLSATRAQDGVTGRWLNKDPIRELGGINLYGYVGANPVSFIDQQGTIDPEEVHLLFLSLMFYWQSYNYMSDNYAAFGYPGSPTSAPSGNWNGPLPDTIPYSSPGFPGSQQCTPSNPMGFGSPPQYQNIPNTPPAPSLPVDPDSDPYPGESFQPFKLPPRLFNRPF